MRALLLLGFLVAFQAAADPKKMVIIGDSLTEGFGVAREKAYPALLEALIRKSGKEWKVVNSGIGGSTTASAPSRVQWALKQKPKPDLIILALGANDGLRGHNVISIENNLTRAIESCKSAGVRVVLATITVPPNYGADYTKKFNAVFPRLSSRHGVPLANMLLEGVGGKPELNLPDGLHPNEKGHEIMANNIFKAIEKLL